MNSCSTEISKYDQRVDQIEKSFLNIENEKLKKWQIKETLIYQLEKTMNLLTD